MRKNIVAGNWKMNNDYDEGLDLIKAVLKGLEKNNTGKAQVIFGTPFIHLRKASKICLEKKQASVAAQNCHEEELGAFTGEISAKMVRSTGAKYVIIGHSERRQYFHENHEQLKKKVNVALHHGLLPIFCVGESLQAREEEHHFDLIKRQVDESLFHLTAAEFSKLVIAYEPVWAIGTGKTATKEQAQEMHAFIRQMIAMKYGSEITNELSILYGGSCKADNAKELFMQPDVDGGLIGGASLKAEEFLGIIKSF